MKNKVTKIAFAILLIISIILLIAPSIIKGYVVDNSKELIGAKVTIGKLKYNYFTSTVRVYDFALYEQNDKDEFVSLDTLILNLEPLKLISDKVEVEQFYVKGLRVKTILKDSVFNFEELANFYSTEDTISVEDTPPFKYSVSDIEFKDSNIIFDNQDVGTETKIKDLSFFIPYIGWDQEKKSSADIKFNFENGGYFQSSLNINPVDGEFDALITLRKLDLEPFYEYVLPYMDINSFSGSLNSKIKIEGNVNEAVNSIVSGHVDVDDFSLTDTNDKTVLSSKTINCNLEKIDYANESYTLDSIALMNPYIYFEMDSVSNTIFKLLKPYFDSEELLVNDSINNMASDSVSELYYGINHFIVRNGVLDYRDNLTGETFDYHLSDIKISSDSIFSDSKWVAIESDMLLNKRGTLHANLGFNPNDFMNTTLDFRIENFLLSDINIYSKYYTGHNVLEGDFYYYSKSKIVDGQIASENKLYVKNVEVTSDGSKLNSLPLKFALFLLKDRDGNVNLDVPVRGDLNDPKVSIGKLIWSTFKNLIVKIVSSPINFLAGLVDGDPKEMEELKYSYLDTVASDKSKKTMKKLIELEKKKKGLQIDLTYLIDNDVQKEIIAEDIVGSMFNENTGGDYSKNKEAFELYLKEKTGVDSLSVSQSISLLVKDENLDSISQDYSNSRISDIKNYLKSQNDFTQIRITHSDSILPKTPESYPKFLIKYSMIEEQ